LSKDTLHFLSEETWFFSETIYFGLCNLGPDV